MDVRLDRLRTSFMNSWFPNDIEIFRNEDACDTEELLEIFFTDYLERYRTAFPAFRGRVYNDFPINDPLALQDVDGDILRILGVTTVNPPGNPDRFSNLSTITGRQINNVDPQAESPYMAEQAAMDLYTHITVDEWSGRMDKPLIMWDDDTNTEYIQPSMTDFIVLYLKERPIDIDTIPSSLYPSVEAFITYKLAEYVLNALGRYPLSLALKDLTADTDSTSGGLDPSKISSLTIAGKITLSMAASSETDYEKLSNLFGSGSVANYLSDLSLTMANAKKIFEVLKYTRLGGISVS